MVAALPLMLIPLVVFNLVAFRVFGGETGDPWLASLLTLDLPSGARFTLASGDLLLIVAVLLLFVEILKATRTGSGSIADHMLSLGVFVIYLVEFIVVPSAAHGVFAVLTVIALIDVIAGFSITISGARRDVGWGG